MFWRYLKQIHNLSTTLQLKEVYSADEREIEFEGWSDDETIIN